MSPDEPICQIRTHEIHHDLSNFHLLSLFFYVEVICLWEILLFAHRTRSLLINGAALWRKILPKRPGPSSTPKVLLDEQIEEFCTCLGRHIIDFPPPPPA
ncbi:hypothetical protein TNCV_2961651 [Trichonephila clavipes]|nr:hypothetical protein TNCV_2961651 [Trichonephila clavipes]